jgi:hypothetical protein
MITSGSPRGDPDSAAFRAKSGLLTSAPRAKTKHPVSEVCGPLGWQGEQARSRCRRAAAGARRGHQTMDGML